MPSQSSASKKSSASCCCFSLKSLSFLAIFLALFSAVYSYLDARLDQFYIFNPEHLHDLSQRAIKAHGDDTRSVVNFIVTELEEKVGSQYLSTEEEWVFNNAGGAMGAMYIIHASTSILFTLSPRWNLVFWLSISYEINGKRNSWPAQSHHHSKFPN